MKTFFKPTAIALALVSLTACIEVKDNNNNDEVVSALQAQNEILAAQNEAQQAENSVTITGKVTNISTDSAAQGASVVIKVGNDWSEAVEVAVDGSFELTALPYNSDYTLVVKSTGDAFLNRTYYGTTRAGTSGVNFQDIGELLVSEGELKSYAVLDSQTNESILGLSLYSYSHVYQSYRVIDASDKKDYYHTGSYNEATSQYEIVLPKDLALSIYADLDLDDDGDNDYHVEGGSSSGSTLVRSSDVNEISSVYLIDQTLPEQEIEFRVSMLDKEGNVLSNLSLMIDDQLNEEILSEFDESTQQYVLTAKFAYTIKILSPAFSKNEQSYDSSYISISRNDEKIQVRTYAYDSNGYHSYNYYNVPLDSTTLDLILQPRETNSGNTTIELLTKSTGLHANNTTYKAFYSQPIQLDDNSVELMQKNVLSVIRGNDSLDDLVLSGTTLISQEDVLVNSTAELSLNNTQLTARPESALQGGYQYQYLINEVIDSSTETLVNISNDDSAVFEVKSQNDDAFDINTLQLDNNNYYTNAELITTENTAGDTTNYSHGSSYVYLIIPASAVNTLKSFTLQKMIVTNQGNSNNDVDSWRIINDGQTNYLNTRYAVSTAENEVITYNNYNSYSIYKGLASPDGKVYLLNTSEYLYDNTESSENSITFQYSFETLDGEISTGSITLAVQ